MDDSIMLLYAVSVPFFLSAVLGWLFIPRVLILSHRKRLFDMPDERKMHNRPIPRLGGITFLPILLMCVCIVVGLWVMMDMPYHRGGVHLLLVRFVLLFVGMMMLFLEGLSMILLASLISVSSWCRLPVLYSFPCLVCGFMISPDCSGWVRFLLG